MHDSIFYSVFYSCQLPEDDIIFGPLCKFMRYVVFGDASP
jgi:hypothetical protein